MEHRDGRQGDRQAWNHASAGGQQAQRAPEAGGLKPLAPMRPLATYPPNEPYDQRRPAPARPAAPAYDPYAAPPPAGAPYPPYPRQAGSPPYEGYPPQQGYPPANAAGYPPPLYPPQAPRRQAGDPAGEPYPSQGDPTAPWRQPEARPAWLPESVAPMPAQEPPMRRTLLQSVPQTAPPPWPAPVPPMEQPAPDPHADALRRRRAAAHPADTVAEPYDAPDRWPPEGGETLSQGVPASAFGPEEDSGRFEPAPHPPLPEPVTVPTMGYRAPRRGGGRRFLRAVLLTLAALCVVAAALYFTGALGYLTGTLRPAGGAVPSVFGQMPGSVAAGVAPAAKAPVPALRAITVSPETATAPATLTFTLTTNAAVTSIRLLTENGSTIHTTAYATPQGDGLTWAAAAEMDTPYTGKVRVFLRDAAGQWSAGEQTVDVAVQ